MSISHTSGWRGKWAGLITQLGITCGVPQGSALGRAFSPPLHTPASCLIYHPFCGWMLHLPAAVFLGWRLLSADPGEGGELKKETAFGPQLSSPLVEFTFRAGMSGWLRLPDSHCFSQTPNTVNYVTVDQPNPETGPPPKWPHFARRMRSLVLRM